MAPKPWLKNRAAPLLATVVLILIGMSSSTWWSPELLDKGAWQLPDDLWGTLVAAHRLLHLNLGGLYTPPTGLVAFPGAAVILLPVVAVIDVAGLSLAGPGVHNPDPAVWLVAGPYEIALSGTVLFAADAIAQRLGASGRARLLLAAAGAIAVWNVSVEWGHPEDAVAVALLFYGVLALANARIDRSAWLVGAAVAVQPLVLLAVPLMLAVLPVRRLPGYLLRAAAPGVGLLGAALVSNFSATLNAVTEQPNWPTVDHPSPFVSLAPHLSHGVVAAGPARSIAVVLACGCALVFARRWRGVTGALEWSNELLEELLWWVAVTLALRCIFESVMVAYYVWPALAAALVAAVHRVPRLLTAALLASALTLVVQHSWNGRLTWWETMVAGLTAVLASAHSSRPAIPRRPRTPALPTGSR